MIHFIETIDIDGEKFISYCSESDFEYSIRIGQKCKVILISKSTFSGTVFEINENSFILQLPNGNTKEIKYFDTEDIFCEEENGTMKL